MLNTREKLLEWKLFDAKSEQTLVGWAADRPTAHMLFASRKIYEAKLTKLRLEERSATSNCCIKWKTMRTSSRDILKMRQLSS